MRNDEEIIERIKKQEKTDIFGTRADLIYLLPFDKAKQFLKEGVEKKQYTRYENSKKALTKEMIDYLPFAFDKAEGERGISANRSIDHFRNWLWLLEDNELLAFSLDETNYPPYGLPVLKKIKEKYDPSKEEK